MNRWAIVIILVAAAAMIFGLSKQKAGAAWGKPLAIACAVAALLTVAYIFAVDSPRPTTQAFDRAMAYEAVGAQKLGSYLAAKFPHTSAVVVVEPQLAGAENRKTKALLQGLKKGFGQQITIIDEVSPEIPQKFLNEYRKQMPRMPDGEGADIPKFEMIPPLEYWFTSEIFNQIIARYKDHADLIVTTIGLPQDIAKLNIDADTPKLALLSGSVYELRPAIRAGAIVAAVVYKSMGYDERPPPADLDEAFNRGFLLITTENIQKMASEYGEMFLHE